MTTRTYGFKLNHERPKYSGDTKSFVITVMAREDDCRYPVNPRSDGEHAIFGAPKRQDGLMLSGLGCRVYRCDYGRGVTRTGFEFLHSYYSVGASEAKRMVATFAAIDRELKKTDYPAEIGDYVECVARAIGATWFAFPHNGEERGSSYPDSEWTFLSIRELKDAVRAAERKFEAEFAAEHPDKVNAV